jgi:hypothetical protein
MATVRVYRVLAGTTMKTTTRTKTLNKTGWRLPRSGDRWSAAYVTVDVKLDPHLDVVLMGWGLQRVGRVVDYVVVVDGGTAGASFCFIPPSYPPPTLPRPFLFVFLSPRVPASPFLLWIAALHILCAYGTPQSLIHH